VFVTWYWLRGSFREESVRTGRLKKERGITGAAKLKIIFFLLFYKWG